MRNLQSVLALHRTVQVLESELDRDLPFAHVISFFMVATAGEDGIDQGALQQALGTSSASISRTLQTLSSMHYLKNRAGLQLISRELDVMDNRRRIVRLTPKGVKLLEKAREFIE